jgi:farnesyl-diphosphate farnesyltransferase
MQLTTPSSSIEETEFQIEMLKGVSRTFALTIPQLPAPLHPIVTNAYLLCRIIDTIEDEITLTYTEKEHFCSSFLKVVFGSGDPCQFADDLGKCLSEKTIPAEHLLIRYTPRVIAVTRRLTETQQNIIRSCLTTMVRGMLHYQKYPPHRGLRDFHELNRYCYFVAGTVGELLTNLFSDYSPEIAKRKDRLMSLANCFGQGLQLTNILKDIWEDLENGICWLPRDIFAGNQYNLDRIRPLQNNKEFESGIRRMTGIACGQLQKAFDYSMTIPPNEKGIRKFCLWNIGMAAYTLRKINKNPGFSAAEEVKISRKTVRFVAASSNLCISSDTALKLIFKLWIRGLHSEKIELPDPALYN